MQVADEARCVDDPDRPGCAAEDVSPCASVRRTMGGPPDPVAPSPEIDALLWRWQAAVAGRQHVLPPFEDLALGSLGRGADNAALARLGADGTLRLFRAGSNFSTWIDASTDRLDITRRSSGRLRVLFETVTSALEEGRPARNVAHSLVNFVLCSDEIAVLPLSSRWGPPICLVYLHERERSCNLLECVFQATAEGLLALSLVRDRSGRPADFQILTANKGAARLLQRSEADLAGQRLSEAAICLAESSVISRLLETLARGENARFELDQPTASGEVVHLNVDAAPMGAFIAVTLTNIGDVKRREASFRLLFDRNPVPMWLCDSAGQDILAINDAAVALYGYDRATFLTTHICGAISCDSCRSPNWNDESGEDLQTFEHITRHVRADGSQIDVHIYGRGITFEGASANLVTIIDVTEQKRAEAQIVHIAHHDALTGLANRVLFMQQLDEALLFAGEGQSIVALLYLDLDHFKNVNDTMGHLVGDRLLRDVGQRLRQVLRKNDLIGRLGGDEFAIIQMDIESPDNAAQLARRIVDALGKPFELDGLQITVGASIGVALSPADGTTSSVLLRKADIALYRAKEDGRRTYCLFSPDLDARALARRMLERDLRDAHARGEFELYYQPLVTLESGSVSGFEALIRWNHPSRGLVEPAEFIAVAEETGLIVLLGEWVLNQACIEAMQWPDHTKVSVNLSPGQFKSGNLFHVVSMALVGSGLPPSRLELEITETVLLEDSETVRVTLNRLRALGVGIVMDDFGTGYSYLSYLRAFPFTKIKIDRSFVNGLADSEQCKAIIRAVTGLGSSLGMSITAEGVENLRQLEWLESEGCTEIQGYLFSPPVPKSEVNGLLDRRCVSLKPRKSNRSESAGRAA